MYWCFAAINALICCCCCCLHKYASMWPLFIYQRNRKKRKKCKSPSFQSNVNGAFEISYLSLPISLHFFLYIVLLITHEYDDEEEYRRRRILNWTSTIWMHSMRSHGQHHREQTRKRERERKCRTDGWITTERKRKVSRIKEGCREVLLFYYCW